MTPWNRRKRRTQDPCPPREPMSAMEQAAVGHDPDDCWMATPQRQEFYALVERAVNADAETREPKARAS